MIGERVGNFQLVRRLGQGGMGEVWLAEQVEVRTTVAIKFLHALVADDRQQVQRFFNEAVAVSKIKHAGITKIFDVGFLSGDRPYLVMEFLDGETLGARARRQERLPLTQLIDVAQQIAGVLEATHAEQITHRDLKPDNIFLVRDTELLSGERIKVLDFGIAKLGAGQQRRSATTSSMGTPAYMSPEQWRAAATVDGRADVYSLGCVMFELACGRTPFVASSIGEMCEQHLNETPPSIRSLVSSLPAAFDDLLARMLAKEPADRPSIREVKSVVTALARVPSMDATLPAEPVPAASGDVALDIANKATVESLPPRQRPRPRTHSSPRVRLLGGAVGAAIIVTTGALILGGRSTPSRAKCQPAAIDASADQLFATAECFEATPSIAPAIEAYRAILERHPSSPLVPAVTLHLAKLYRTLGQFADAATLLEQYATRPTEPQAPDALLEAIELRRALGHDAEAINAAGRFVTTWGTARPSDAATAQFLLNSIYQRRSDSTQLVAHLRAYLRDHAAASSPDKVLIAHALLGQTLWKRSCPVAGVVGACVEVTPPPVFPTTFTARAPTMCGPHSLAARITVIPRTPEAVEALAEIERATRLRQPNAGGAERIANETFASAKLAEADAQLEAFLTHVGPGPGTDNLDAWTAKASAVAEATTDRFVAVDQLGVPSVSIAVAARKAQIAERLYRALMSHSIPERIRTVDASLEKYCDHVVSLAEPFEKLAISSYADCVEIASRIGFFNEWSGVCATALGSRSPDTFPTANEVVASPVSVSVPVALDAPHLNELRTKLEQLRAMDHDDTRWREHEARLRELVASALGHDPTDVRAHVLHALILMEGAEHEPSRLELARLILEDARARTPDSALLRNAIGVLAFRTGDTSAALAQWQAADDPYARYNLGLFMLVLRRFDDARHALTAPPSQSVAYEFHVATGVAARGTKNFVDAEHAYRRAIGLDSTRPEAHFALGVLYKDFIAPDAPDLVRAKAAYQQSIDHFKQVELRSATSLGARATEAIAVSVKTSNQIDRFLSKKP